MLVPRSWEEARKKEGRSLTGDFQRYDNHDISG